MSKRIQITRDDFIKSLIEVQAPPQVLVSKLDKAPFCHLLSTYVIRPVASDENPFIIHHKNKQPVFVQQKKFGGKGKFNQESDPAITRNEPENEESSDDEFQTVKTDKKRVKKAPQ